MTVWSLEAYCQKQAAYLASDESSVHLPAFDHPSTHHFLDRLGLPTRHPFCFDSQPQHHSYLNDNSTFAVPGVPPMGALDGRFMDGQSLPSQMYTLWCMVTPAVLAMTELWLRLFAGMIAPCGFVYLSTIVIMLLVVGKQDSRRPFNQAQQTLPSSPLNKSMANWRLSVVVVLTVASSLVLMTDTLIVLENGPVYGTTLFVASVVISLWVCHQHHFPQTSVAVLCLVLLAIHLIWDIETNTLVFGDKIDHVADDKVRAGGLYYNTANPLVAALVAHWPKSFRTYDRTHGSGGATPWMTTGDARTGLPFLFNRLPNPKWHRVFLEIDNDDHDNAKSYSHTDNHVAEYLALDISFPNTGHDPSQPVYLVLHGLNGGSSEEYVRDFTWRRNHQGSTVVVMVARGLMDLPIRGWHNFHGARVSDAHAAAMAVRKAIVVDDDDDNTAATPTTTTKTTKPPLLVGVGYSMGAIVLSNYVASHGSRVPLDGAIAFSGGLDMRNQEYFPRAQRLWQPMLAETLRDDFLLGKWGYRAKERLSKDHFTRMMRASHVTAIDRYAVVSYNDFDDLDHYYRSMSALGDIPRDVHGNLPLDGYGKIHTLAVPLVVVQALDDPLVTWRATCQNSGGMHPDNLVRSGVGNLAILLTKAGGHVGWPLGWMPWQEKWRWMSDAAGSFGVALGAAKKELQESNNVEEEKTAR